MLKGQTTIELTDVNTGEKEVVQSDNMFTNALQNIVDTMIKHLGVKNLGQFGALGNNLFPILKNALGGIMLFDSELEENANNILPPTSDVAGCTAYANVYSNNTDDARRGSLNKIESVSLDNGYKFVWDFSTAQGNGRIASAALTTKTGGVCGPTPNRYAGLFLKSESDTSTIDSFEAYTSSYTKTLGDSDNRVTFNFTEVAGADTTMALSEISAANVLYFDAENFCFKMGKCEKIDGAMKLFLFDSYFNIVKLGIGDSPNIISNKIENCRSCNIGEINVFGNTNLPLMAAPADEKACYLVKSTSSDTLVVAKINTETAKLDYCKTIPLTPYNTYNSYYHNSSPKEGRIIAIQDKFLYVYGGTENGKYVMLKINTENTSEINKIVCKDSVASHRTFSQGRSPIYQGKRMIFPGGVIENDELTLSSFFYFDEGGRYWFFTGGIIKDVMGYTLSSYDGSWVEIKLGIISNAMMTINNITPATKTPDKTMKITYIVRDVPDTTE